MLSSGSRIAGAEVGRVPFGKESRKGLRREKLAIVRATLHEPVSPDPHTSIHSSFDLTYGDHNEEWLKQEEARLLSTKTHFNEGILLTRGKWSWNVRNDHHFRFNGKMHFSNLTKTNEIFVCEVEGKVTLLSKCSVENITSTIKFVSHHQGLKPRQDNYWQAFILKAQHTSELEVIVDLNLNTFFEGYLKDIESIRIDIDFVSYGPKGRKKNFQNVILPLNFPSEHDEVLKWRKVENSDLHICAVRTHLLCHQDDPISVLRHYTREKVGKGDVIAIGETPLALMEGRFRNPKNILPSLIALLSCRLFHPTSSLATACGMQALIDIVGKIRVVFAVLGAIVARLFGVRGMFYNLAGPQARLIDDVTGTLPPYDQFITLGPLTPRSTVEYIKQKIGCEIAVVDVNDLRKVQILASTDGVDEKRLTEALLSNPAGNADEQTPIVIVKGASKQSLATK